MNKFEKMALIVSVCFLTVYTVSAQTGTFDFSDGTTNTGVDPTTGSQTITINSTDVTVTGSSYSGALNDDISVLGGGGFGGTTGNVLGTTNSTSTGLTLTFSVDGGGTVNITTLRVAVVTGGTYNLVFTPNTGSSHTENSIDGNTGATVTLNFTGITSIDITPTSGNANIVVDNIVHDGALPVELTSFTAVKLDNAVQLLWETATEVNNYGFEVQRKTDCGEDCNSDWEVLGVVPGHGNSNSPKQYEYIDENIPSDNLLYRLKQIDTDGTFEYYNETVNVNADNITGVESDNLPGEFSLSQNYPNPFNPVTQIRFSVAEKSKVILSVYNTLGEQVAELINAEYSPGTYGIEFNAENLPSGLYIYKLQAGDKYNAVGKMVLVK